MHFLWTTVSVVHTIVPSLKNVFVTRCPTRNHNRADDVRPAVCELLGLALRVLRGRGHVHHVVSAVAAPRRLHSGNQPLDLGRGAEVY